MNEKKFEKGKLKPFPERTTVMPKCWDAVDWDENGNDISEEDKELDAFIEKSNKAFTQMDDDREDLFLGKWKERRQLKL